MYCKTNTFSLRAAEAKGFPSLKLRSGKHLAVLYPSQIERPRWSTLVDLVDTVLEEKKPSLMAFRASRLSPGGVPES